MRTADVLSLARRVQFSDSEPASADSVPTAKEKKRAADTTGPGHVTSAPLSTDRMPCSRATEKRSVKRRRSDRDTTAAAPYPPVAEEITQVTTGGRDNERPDSRDANATPCSRRNASGLALPGRLTRTRLCRWGATPGIFHPIAVQNPHRDVTRFTEPNESNSLPGSWITNAVTTARQTTHGSFACVRGFLTNAVTMNATDSEQRGSIPPHGSAKRFER